MGKTRPSSARTPNAAYHIGRAVQLLGLLGGTLALLFMLSVMPNRDLSVARPLGLALLSGAVFTVGWLIQRHWGDARARGNDR